MTDRSAEGLKVPNHDCREALFTLACRPAPLWEMAPTGDFSVVTFHFSAAPNGFHRLMQRVFFGFVWREKK